MFSALNKQNTTPVINICLTRAYIIFETDEEKITNDFKYRQYTIVHTMIYGDSKKGLNT